MAAGAGLDGRPFRRLMRDFDPAGVFGNDLLDRYLPPGPAAAGGLTA